jgi:hypothetical protein
VTSTRRIADQISGSCSSRQSAIRADGSGQEAESGKAKQSRAGDWQVQSEGEDKLEENGVDGG